VSLGLVAAPLGLDGAVARKSVVMSSALLRRGLGCSALVAIIATIYVHLTYPITPTIAMLLIASICSGGVTGLVSTYFQTEHAYARALFYTRSQDFALFIAAIAAVGISSRVALMPFAVMALVFLVVGLYAWPDALRAAGSAAIGS